MWATLVLTTALNLAPAQGSLELKNVRATYGLLGQERKDNTVLPGDIYFVHFDIDGLQVGKDDRIRYSMGVEFLNKDGKSEFKKDPVPQEVVNTLGGSVVPAFANAQIGLDVPPGEYTLKVTVADLASKNTQTLTRKFEVLPRRFGLVRLGFAYDNVASAPPTGVVGQSLIVQFTAVEVTFNDKNKADLLAEATILDEAGKPTLSQPLQGRVQDITEEFRKLRVVPMSFPVFLNRAGKFKVNLTVSDKLSGKKVEQTLDLTAVDIK
jgi:hypothetical protein